MKRFSEQLKKKASSIRLSASERADLRERLVGYLEYHPLPESNVVKTTATPSLTTEPFKLISLSSVYFRGFAASFAVLLIVGVPLVAERSLPGDVLYPVKVSFNEELRSSLTLSPYEKVEWETERLSRRVAEARLLASEGKLTEEQEVEVAEAVKAHSDAAKREIETIRQTDAEEAAIAEIAFSSALEVQSAVLKSEEQHTTTGTTTVGALAGAVEEERSAAAQKQSESEEVPSIERLLGRVEQETTRAYELLETVRGYAGEQEVADIDRRLADIERKIASALALREEPDVDEKDVRSLLRESLQSTQKLIVFMTDIDVRKSVVINDLLPVELTDEERVAAVNNTLSDIAGVIEITKMRLSSTTDQALQDKVEVGLSEIAELTASASTSLATGDIAAAEQASAAAFDLSVDVAGLLSIIDGDLPEPADEPEVTDPATTTDDVLDETPAEPIVEGASTTDDTLLGNRPTSSEDIGGGQV